MPSAFGKTVMTECLCHSKSSRIPQVPPLMDARQRRKELSFQFREIDTDLDGEISEEESTSVSVFELTPILSV